MLCEVTSWQNIDQHRFTMNMLSAARGAWYTIVGGCTKTGGTAGCAWHERIAATLPWSLCYLLELDLGGNIANIRSVCLLSLR